MADSTNSSTPQNAVSSPARSQRHVAIWLFVMCGLLAAMVIVGGATRLTDSGLSITEWKPVTGAVPPLSETAWLAEFEKYKTIPEYEEVNFGMSLDQFKSIYWWEWGHRFLGRLIGVAFLIPMLFFLFTGQVGKSLGLKLGGLFLLGGMQGALGWWMVSSGLTERVDVSQYRLVAHLSLAVLLFGLMFWLALSLWPVKKTEDAAKLFMPAMFLAGAVYLQMMLGGFVAGLRAGRTFNTWPLMDGKFFPDGYFAGAPGFSDLFETIAAVQFNHRIGAYLVAVGAVWFFFMARRSAIAPRAKMLLAMVGLQVALGIWTVVAATPISLGLLHQAGALTVLASALYAAHGCAKS